MGYRSQVVIELSKEKSDLLQALYCVNFPEDTEWLFSSIENFDDKAVLYYFSDIKWYDSYPEVAFIERFLNELDEKEYAFARTGEEPDDIEERGSGYYYDLRVRREVTIEWDQK